MGTNYYLEPEVVCCAECGRPFSTLHIGKSSGGWEFSFFSPDETLKSWADWKRLLQSEHGCIRNEYNQEIPVEEFIAKVEASKGKRNHFDYMREGGSGDSNYWKDSEGWSFQTQEFF